MTNRRLACFVTLFLLAGTVGVATGQDAAEGSVVRVGVLGFDSYQAVAFTQLFHKPPADNPDLKGIRVVAAWPGGSEDLAKTLEDVERWKPRLIAQGVKIVATPKDVLQQCDAVMVMSVDGRAHASLVKQTLAAGKPCYVGRPLAGSLANVMQMFRWSQEHDTPMFSCSQHRYSPGFASMRAHPEVGAVVGCNVHGGYKSADHHSEYFWHAIHSFETMYAIMGAGAVSVSTRSTATADIVTAVWKDDRVGVYRGIKVGAPKYSAMVFGDKGVAPAGQYGYPAAVKGVVPKSRYKGYEGVATEIAKFFKTRKSPIAPEETIELFALMEAARISKSRNGAVVRVSDVLKAEAE